MGHLQRPSFGIDLWNGRYQSWNDAQSFVMTELFAGVKQHLHPDTDTQQRKPFGNVLEYRVVKPSRAKRSDAVTECPDPGENQAGGSNQGTGIFCHNHGRTAML
jgi:hypothetical protein